MLTKLSCGACDAVFKIGFVEPQVTKPTYNYCPNCSSEGITVEQFSDEEYAFETLAEAWNIKVEVFKMFYTAWVQTPNSPRTLKEFMIQQLEKASETNK